MSLRALALAALAAGAVGDGGEEDVDPMKFSRWQGQKYIFVGELLTVIVLSLLFEMATDRLRELLGSLGRNGESMLLMMDCVTKEIMILGFIGLLVFSATKTSLAQDLASELYPESMLRGPEDPLAETFETVHMMIFCVMMCFVTQGSTLMYKCYGECEKWKLWEDMQVHHGLQSQTTIASMMHKEGYLKRKTGMHGCGSHESDSDSGGDDDDPAKTLHAHLSATYTMASSVESVQSPIQRLFMQGGVLGVLEWRALRHDFMFPAIRSDQRTELDSEITNMYMPEEPQFFRFTEYLTEKLGCEFVDLMEVDLSTWVAASALSLSLPWALSAGPEWYATIAACGASLIVLMFLGFTVHVFDVYRQLMIPLPKDPLAILLALRGTDTVSIHRKVKHQQARTHRTRTEMEIRPDDVGARVSELERGISEADKRLSDVAKEFGIRGFNSSMERKEYDGPLGTSPTASPRSKRSPGGRQSERTEQPGRPSGSAAAFAERFHFKAITLESLKPYHRPRYIQLLELCLRVDTTDRVLHPTYQDQLFIFHEHGPWIMKKVFELLMFCQSICMASFIVIWLTVEEWSLYQYAVFSYGVAVLAWNLWFLVPRLLSKFAMVTSIDFFKDIGLCEAIMSDNKKLQIVETLRLLKIARMEGKIERLNTRTLTDEMMQKYVEAYHDSFGASKKRQFEHMFHVFDADGSGSISLREMKKALISLGIPQDSALVTGAERVMELIDVNGSKTIELEEFQSLLAMAFLKQSEDDQKADLDALFQKFDVNNNGYLSIEELTLAFEELGVSISTDDMAELVYQVFLTFKQVLALHEFGEFMEGLEAKFSE